MTTGSSDHPQHDLVLGTIAQARTIEEFITWLLNESEYEVCVRVPASPDGGIDYEPAVIDVDIMVLRSLGIDPDELEKEAELLDEQRRFKELGRLP